MGFGVGRERTIVVGLPSLILCCSCASRLMRNAGALLLSMRPASFSLMSGTWVRANLSSTLNVCHSLTVIFPAFRRWSYAHFERAYAVWPDPNLLSKIGLKHRNVIWVSHSLSRCNSSRISLGIHSWSRDNFVSSSRAPLVMTLCRSSIQSYS